MPYVYHSPEALIFLSIPQTFLTTWFGFICLGTTTTRLWSRLLWFSFIYSVLSDISLHLIPVNTQFLVMPVSLLTGLHLVFRDLRWTSKAAISLIAYMACMLADSVMLYEAELFIVPQLLRTGPPIYKVLLGWPIFLLTGAACMLMQHTRYYPVKRLLVLLRRAKQIPSLYFILFILTQILVLALFLITNRIESYNTAIIVSILLVMSAIPILSFLTIRLIVRTRDNTIREIQSTYANDVLHIFQTIREQRHDFTNHVQDMYMLLKSGRLDDLRNYIEETSEEIRTISPIQGSAPASAIEAFIQAKKAVAIDNKIRFICRTINLPATFTEVKNSDLVRILGNLIDNAFDETVKLPAIERFVNMEIRSEEAYVIIEVANRGSMLSGEESRHIFEPGISTKDGKHAGLGLSIVAEIVHHYGGKVAVRSGRHIGVCFTVCLPAGSIAANRER